MAKLKLNTDRIIGLSAMLISLLTLIIFFYQTNLIRTQSRLSVTPRIAFNNSLDTRDSISTFSFFIINKGLGPAIIESIEIIKDEDRFKLDFPNFIKEVFPDFKNYGNVTQSMTLDTGTTLSEQETLKFFTFSFNKKNFLPLRKYLEVGDYDKMPFEIEVVYSSIYGEKWTVNSNKTGHPIKF